MFSPKDQTFQTHLHKSTMQVLHLIEPRDLKIKYSITAVLQFVQDRVQGRVHLDD